MAIYKIPTLKDSTIYSLSPTKNTGVDSILEISSYINNNNRYNTRTLIQFSNEEIQTALSLISGSYETFLNLKIANSSGLSDNVLLNVFPISSSWEMGIGKFNNLPLTEDGVSWVNRNNDLTWNNEGGDFLTASLITSSLNYQSSKDLNVNVSSITTEWVNNNIPNNGFLVKLDDTIESSINKNIQPILKYFSTDTNTIYPPYLEFKWNDFIYNTGSNGVLNTTEAFISSYNNKKYYYNYDVFKFKIASILKYPKKTFKTTSHYVDNLYLPPNSTYAIKDAHTNEYIINFDDEYTLISADEESSYFIIYMNSLQPERYYKILIKSKFGNFIKVFDDNLIFKVING